MELDMYLTADRYLSRYSEEDKNTLEELSKVKSCLLSDFRISNITYDLAYWRKANAIHNWFVKECQGGVYECQKTWVSIEQLKKLRDVCKIVLEDHSQAERLLPTGAGFFFGSTDYDEYYYQDLAQTVDIIDKILAMPNIELIYIYYRSSW
jgi:hypothetical protein